MQSVPAATSRTLALQMPTHRNDQDRSWRRKVARAEEHLVDFANRIAPLQERRAYPVREGFEDYEGSRQYVRRVSLPHLDDPMLEILPSTTLSHYSVTCKTQTSTASS